MSFNVAADAYDRFMGRYSRHLSAQLADFAGVRLGQRVLDVGCGPGALTAELVARVGASSVAAVDPSEPFVATARERNPGVDVRMASADDLPFPHATFDAVLAQLVVHFLSDPEKGLSEMARVARRGGVVSACVWDHGGGHGPHHLYWRAARGLDPDVDDQSRLPGARAGHLAQLFKAVGLQGIESSLLWVNVEHPTFEDWWEPFTTGVGPAGTYFRSLATDRQVELREACRASIPTIPFVVTAGAWAARGVV